MLKSPSAFFLFLFLPNDAYAQTDDLFPNPPGLFPSLLLLFGIVLLLRWLWRRRKHGREVLISKLETPESTVGGIEQAPKEAAPPSTSRTREVLEILAIIVSIGVGLATIIEKLSR